jgi:hypothetical protein
VRSVKGMSGDLPMVIGTLIPRTPGTVLCMSPISPNAFVSDYFRLFAHLEVRARVHSHASSLRCQSKIVRVEFETNKENTVEVEFKEEKAANDAWHHLLKIGRTPKAIRRGTSARQNHIFMVEGTLVI